MKVFVDRWRVVEEIETKEQQTATIAERWQQLNAIFGIGKSLEILDSDDPEEELIIRRRWRRLQHKM